MNGGTQPIEHIVVLMFENRSFDHLFGAFPGANGLLDENGGVKPGICNLANPTQPAGPSNQTYLPVADHIADVQRGASETGGASSEVLSAARSPARWTLREIPGWRRPAPRRRRRSRTRFPNVHPAADLGLVSECEDLNPTAQTAHSTRRCPL